jgi:hypothetical protein
MEILTPILIILGLTVFEAINSIDNAVINAEVLGTVGQRARKWFLTWGIFIAVFVVRGFLPLLIVWAAIPGIGLWNAATATMSSDPAVIEAIDRSAPILLIGAGMFLLLLFLHWIFLEPKRFGLPGERFLFANGVWFFAVASFALTAVIWFALKADPLLAFGAAVGSSAFFLVSGFKDNAERAEADLKSSARSDISKILYLEMIDAAFSIDGVLGAFAFTLSIPLILLGNGFGAIIVRWMTVSNIERIKRYVFLKHGAMYSILFLGLIMIGHGFGMHIPDWVSPVITLGTIAYFFTKSVRFARLELA